MDYVLLGFKFIGHFEHYPLSNLSESILVGIGYCGVPRSRDVNALLLR
jgi:hypothetical protein